MPPKLLVANLFEYTLIAVGWLLIWRTQFPLKERHSTDTLRQPPIETYGGATIILGLLWIVLTGVLFTGYSPLGFYAGALFALFNIYSVNMARLAQGEKPPPPPVLRIALTAVITCVIVISVVIPVQKIWESILVRLQLPTDHQELIEVFKNAKTTGKLALLTFNAVIIAPVTEELFFRAGLFGFLRTRVPRLVALLVPALLFAVLHVDRTNLKGLITFAPLTALAIVFSLAYERTGRITVPILAHALFNLHTVIFLLLGFAD